MKQAQIVLYVIFGLVILLIFLGLINLVFQVFTAKKIISAQDVNQYTNNCLDLSLNCALYAQGLIMQESLITDYTKQSLKLCLGDLAQKFKGNKFTFEDEQPTINFNEETTTATINKLGEMINGNTKKTLERYATNANIAYAKIKKITDNIKENKAREKKIETHNPRYTFAIYQIDDTKEATIITDKQSKIHGKEYKVFVVS